MSSAINFVLPPIEFKLIDMPKQAEQLQTDINGVVAPTFLDVFTDVMNNAVSTQRQQAQDVIDVMMGTQDNIEEVQLNISKAETALELLVNVKNSVYDAYSEIIRMQI
ncbi:hypothetical protein FACS189499_09900 [Clostridia bacterium]|nr:hypothetical protein FACS189499_09900 [Clostridia bacterium]